MVVVAPSDVKQTLESGERSQIIVNDNVIDPVANSYAAFLARGLESAVNRQIIEQAATTGRDTHSTRERPASRRSRPSWSPPPAEVTLVNVAPSQPTVVQYFAPAVLALILQHLAVTLIALSVEREKTSGLFELFCISPISTFELVTGKLVAYGLFAGLVSLITISLLAVGFHVPMLADPGWIALVVLLLVAGSLGLGLLIAAVSDSEAAAVQLSLLLLLASVFFSGFVLAIGEFSEPVRSLIYALPVANGIRLFSDFMFRGETVVGWQLGLMGAEAVVYIGLAWILLRREMSRA